MTLKLSEIFIPLSGINIYSAEELYGLELHPGFIEKMAHQFQLTYLDNNETKSNLCFAQSNEIRPEYRTTFSKADLLNNIFFQLPDRTVNMKQDEAVFQKGFFLLEAIDNRTHNK